MKNRYKKINENLKYKALSWTVYLCVTPGGLIPATMQKRGKEKEAEKKVTKWKPFDECTLRTRHLEEKKRESVERQFASKNSENLGGVWVNLGRGAKWTTAS